MTVLSGDEFLCINEYNKIYKNCNPLCKPQLIISRSSKDTIPEALENEALLSDMAMITSCIPQLTCGMSASFKSSYSNSQADTGFLIKL